MNKMAIIGFTLAALAAAAFAQEAATQPGRGGRRGGRRGGPGAEAAGPPAASLRKDWVDAATGHRIFRLSTENGSTGLYFHYNAYPPDGKKVVFNSPSGITAVDLDTKKADIVVPSEGRRVSAMEVSFNSNEVYYTTADAVMAADLDTHKTREVVKLPPGHRVTCVNCDGTLFAGTIQNVDDPDNTAFHPAHLPAEDQFARMFPGKKESDLTREQASSAQKETRLAGQLRRIETAAKPQALFILDAKTGEVKTFGLAYAWLNHLQFSPTDPHMLMFCHEGTWHEVDRVWTVDVSKNEPPKLMHKRTMDMEIAGHEWWGHDGKTVWFDLQKPRSGNFFIGGVNIQTGQETDYPVERNWWGVHYNVSYDGKMFSSDGGDPGQVAFGDDDMWINLLRIQPGNTLSREKLVDMRKHNYVTPASGGINGVEPNCTFSPDDKYIVFTGNFDGAQHVYAVEIAKASQ